MSVLQQARADCRPRRISPLSLLVPIGTRSASRRPAGGLVALADDEQFAGSSSAVNAQPLSGQCQFRSCRTSRRWSGLWARWVGRILCPEAHNENVWTSGCESETRRSCRAAGRSSIGRTPAPIGSRRQGNNATAGHWARAGKFARTGVSLQRKTAHSDGECGGRAK